MTVSRARRIAALIAVVAGSLAGAALFKHETCACSGGLPYREIALWSGVGAAAAFGMYVAVGAAFGRR